MCRVGWEGVYLVFLCWQLCCVRLVGILLLVYIKFPLFGFVSDVETETVMTGMLGLMVRMCSECEAEREMDGGGSDGVVGSAIISERERERERESVCGAAERLFSCLPTGQQRSCCCTLQSIPLLTVFCQRPSSCPCRGAGEEKPGQSILPPRLLGSGVMEPDSTALFLLFLRTTTPS